VRGGLGCGICGVMDRWENSRGIVVLGMMSP
jgi:hypothetical protein